MKQEYNQAAIFAALGDPTRQQILSLLTGGALTINALAGNFDISRPAISKHIKILEQVSMITIQEAGRERYCYLDHAGFEQVKDWLAFYENFWMDKMKKFEQVLNSRGTNKEK